MPMVLQRQCATLYWASHYHDQTSLVVRYVLPSGNVYNFFWECSEPRALWAVFMLISQRC